MSKPKILPKIDALNIIDFRLKKEDLVDILVDDKRKYNEELLKDLINETNNLSVKISDILNSETNSLKSDVLNFLFNNNFISKQILELIKKKELYIQTVHSSNGKSLDIYIELNKNSDYFSEYISLYKNMSLKYSFDIEKIILLKKYKKINEYFDLKSKQYDIEKNIRIVSSFNYQDYKKEINVTLTKQILSNINNGEDIFKLINNKNNELIQGKNEETKTEIKSTNRRVRKTTSK